jgi:hypothetical protein
MKTTALSKDIFLIDQFWSINKCDEFIAKSESKGYEAATVQTETGPRVVDHIRITTASYIRILYLPKNCGMSLLRMLLSPLVILSLSD